MRRRRQRERRTGFEHIFGDAAANHDLHFVYDYFENKCVNGELSE